VNRNRPEGQKRAKKNGGLSETPKVGKRGIELDEDIY
jgi:hypothetical protein